MKLVCDGWKPLDYTRVTHRVVVQRSFDDNTYNAWVPGTRIGTRAMHYPTISSAAQAAMTNVEGTQVNLTTMRSYAG